MYIRRIIICGFKSYKKKVVLDLSPGHNVVVGANGSGKSNIYSALEFVLSSKYDMLRSEQRKQLLHDAGQSGVVSAYVEIIFDNSDGRFPINESLISIKRTIGAKKDEYFVNQRHCDKTELNNLLESAGISKYNQHFIVPQGQISQRVKERDNERLILIKEIAGTRVYDERRNESLKLMNNADNKREKVKMVIEYFEQRLDELNDEKEELAKYQKLNTKKRSIEYQIYDKERTKTQRLLDELSENEGKTDEKNEELHDELKELRTEIEEYKNEKGELDNKLNKYTQNIQKKRKEFEKLQKLILTLSTKNKRLKNDNKEYVGQKNKYENELNICEGEINNIKDKLGDIINDFHKQKSKENELRETMKKNEIQIKDLYAKQQRLGQYKSKNERNKQLKKEINIKKEEINQQEKLCKTLKQTNKNIDKKIKTLGGELRKLQKLQKDIDKLSTNNQKAKDNFKRERSKLQNDRKTLWKNLNDTTKMLEELSQKKNKYSNDFRYTMSLQMYQSYQHLKRIQNDIQTKGEQSRYKLSGELYGPVIENFSVIDNKYNIAIEAAGGNKLFYYLVENDLVASEMINIMKKERINRVTFIPLNRMGGDRIKQRKYPKGSADVIPLMKLLRYDDNIDNIGGALIQIFGNTLIPHDLNIGYEYAIRENYQCVTLAGDIVTSGGAMDGGYNINKYKRLKCYGLIKESISRCHELNEEKEEYNDRLKEIEAGLLEIDNKIRENDNEINKNRNELMGNKEKLIEIEEEIGREEELKNGNILVLEKHENDIIGIENSIELIENEMKESLVNKLTENEQNEIENLKTENERIRDNLSKIVVETANIETEKSKFESLLKDNLNKTKKELLKKIQKCNQSYNNEQEIDLITNKLEIETEKKDKLNVEIKQDDKNMENWNKREKTIDKKLNKLTENEQDLLMEIEEHAISCEQLLGKHCALEEKLNQFTKYIVNLGALTNTEINKYKNKRISGLNNMLKQVQKDLIKYSRVNKKALNQYNSFSKEKNKLETRNEEQLTDKIHIEKLMKHLDLKKDDAILRTFHAINDNFKKAFKQLVIRGNAKLILFEHENNNNEIKDMEEDDDDDDDDDEYTQSQLNRRRRSSNVRRGRNRRKSSLSNNNNNNNNNNASQSQRYELDELEDKKYAGIGIRVSFGDDDSDDDDDDVGERDRARDMRQLSGGQQTVVALALIFAIQRCDPSPFYVFDEIDAALDQQYRKAVADIIGGMKGKTQFITTTFRPEILQQADKCFVVDFKAKISTVKQVDDVDEVDITKFT